MIRRAWMSVLLSGVVGAAAAASMGFTFDGYSAGTRLHNVDGWKGWDNKSTDAAVVSNDRAYSGANSILIRGYTDAVWQYDSITSGAWTITAKQYIASGQSGLTYFIVMNNYIDNANVSAHQWSVQLRFDLAAGRVYDDFRGGSVAIATDRWSDVTVEVDLDANTVKQRYNGALISQGTWTTGGGSLRRVSALDLYSSNASSTYYDDVSIANLSRSVPAPGAAALWAAALATAARRTRSRA